MKHLPLTPRYAKAICTIRQLFDIWSLPAVLQETDIIFQKATGEKAWRPPNPYRVVHFCRFMKKITRASFTINASFNEAFSKKIIVPHGTDGPELDKPVHYFGNGRYNTPFSDFPRHLSKEEFRYPAKALSRFCSYRSVKQWKQVYDQLTECALSTTSLQVLEKPGRVLKIREHTFRVIEAAHLIHIRLGKIPISVTNDLIET
jgi:hypothetical protein